MDWVSLERQEQAGSRVEGHALGGPAALQQLDLRTQPVQEEFEQKLFEVFHIGRLCEGWASTIIHWSLRFGIQSKQDSLWGGYKPNIVNMVVQSVLAAYDMEVI